MILFLVGFALGAPGQRGLLHATPDHSSWSARAGLVGGGSWLMGGWSVGWNGVDFAVKPDRRLQVGGLIPVLQDDEIGMPVMAGVSWTVTRPWAPVEVAVGGATLVRGGEATVGFGAVFVAHLGPRVSLDAGGYPVGMVLSRKDWKDHAAADRTPHWDWAYDIRLLAAGVRVELIDGVSLRVGAPDGLTLSIQAKGFYLDAGGASAGPYIGYAHLKVGTVL